jgi:hypothetical protein
LYLFCRQTTPGKKGYRFYPLRLAVGYSGGSFPKDYPDFARMPRSFASVAFFSSSVRAVRVVRG